jgi:hypothetical protein
MRGEVGFVNKPLFESILVFQEFEEDTSDEKDSPHGFSSAWLVKFLGKRVRDVLYRKVLHIPVLYIYITWT